MRALLAQLSPVDGAIEPNLDRLQAVLSQRPDVDLAVFPELYLCGYQPAHAHDLALSVEGEEIERVRNIAAELETAVIVGFAERRENGRVANAAACIDVDGTLAGVYRKTHLFGRRESSVFEEGQDLLLVTLAGRRIGPLICFDVEFPEPARALARAGAELIVTIAANMRPHGGEHALAARARALDNRCPHLYVNRVGCADGLEFVGGSVAIDGSGRLTAWSEATAGAWAPAGTDAPAGKDALAGTDQPAGVQAPAVATVTAQTAGAEQLLEVDVPSASVDVGTDLDYLKHARWDLPVREVPVRT